MEKGNGKIMGILGLISLRKSDLYSKILEKVLKNRALSDEDKIKIKEYISSIRNEDFLSKEERENKIINPSQKIEKLNFDFNKIIKESFK